MTNTEKLLLIEQTRANFESAVKSVLGSDAVSVNVNIYSAAGLFPEAPEAWKKGGAGDLKWAESGFLGVSVFHDETVVQS